MGVVEFLHYLGYSYRLWSFSGGVIPRVSRSLNVRKSYSTCSRATWLTIILLAVMPVPFPVKIQTTFVGSITSDEDRRIVEASCTRPDLGLLFFGRPVGVCRSAPY